LLVYWTGFQKDTADKNKLLEGAEKMKQVAAAVYSSHQVDPRQLAITYSV
jgi:hypothetical protein